MNTWHNLLLNCGQFPACPPQQHPSGEGKRCNKTGDKSVCVFVQGACEFDRECGSVTEVTNYT